MSTPLFAPYQFSPVVFTGDNAIGSELAGQQRRQQDFLNEIKGSISASASVATQRNRVVLTGREPAVVTASTPQEAGLEEKLFDVRVQLKVLIAQYAMHVSRSDRDQIFEQIDDVINVEDWHQEDTLPKPEAFQELLKWSIYSRNYQWKSLGVSDLGDVLVAWPTETMLLTAHFAGEGVVRWTARVRSRTGIEHAAGSCSLQYFDRQAKFYLQQ